MAKKILVAEDEEHIARLVQFKLSKEGYEVTCVTHGGDAIEKLQGGGWDLLILDVMMPVADGWEVLEKMRTHVSMPPVPVLMLTAKGHQRDMANAADLGATHFLRKPFDPNELAQIVRKLVGDGLGK